MNVDIIPISIREWCNEVAGQDGITGNATDEQCLFIIEDRISVLDELHAVFSVPSDSPEHESWLDEQRDLEHIAFNLRKLGVEPKALSNGNKEYEFVVRLVTVGEIPADHLSAVADNLAESLWRAVENEGIVPDDLKAYVEGLTVSVKAG